MCDSSARLDYLWWGLRQAQGWLTAKKADIRLRHMRIVAVRNNDVMCQPAWSIRITTRLAAYAHDYSTPRSR